MCHRLRFLSPPLGPRIGWAGVRWKWRGGSEVEERRKRVAAADLEEGDQRKGLAQMVPKTTELARVRT